MRLTVTLTIGNGPLVGQEYEFRDAAFYVLGRAVQCYPQFPDERPYKDISRHHCLLSIQLPQVRLLDLGSTSCSKLHHISSRARTGPGRRCRSLEVLSQKLICFPSKSICFPSRRQYREEKA
jgi:hypothetical protein